MNSSCDWTTVGTKRRKQEHGSLRWSITPVLGGRASHTEAASWLDHTWRKTPTATARMDSRKVNESRAGSWEAAEWREQMKK